MKALQNIWQLVKDTYCFIGVHQWVYKVENINLKFTDRNRTINVNRNYRICTNCYKCQHGGIGLLSNKWFNEDDKEINSRQKIIRSIKLNKLIKQLS